MNTDNCEAKQSVHGRLAMHPLRLIICPTTGGHFQLSVSPKETVVGLKYSLAKKLKLRPERMSLLHKNR